MVNKYSNLSDTFCIYPFFNLNSNTDGSVKLCCNIRENDHIKKDNGSDYNLGHDSIDSIWNSDYMQTVRQNMLTGKPVKECKDCYRHEELSGSSSRTTSNSVYENNETIADNIDQFLTNGRVPVKQLASLELRLGNTCNLACNSCWGYSSSRVNQEKLAILDNLPAKHQYQTIWSVERQIPAAINHWFKTDVYKNNIQTVAASLERVYITGGEPTMIKENRTLLRNLIDTKNTNCLVSFTTNGTTADSELIDLLTQFPNNEIQISIDGIEDQAHYIRYPLDWKEFSSNVQTIAKLDNVNLVFYTVVNAYNLRSIDRIWHYLDSLSETRPIRWYPIFLDNPTMMRTTIWPRIMRKNIVELLKQSHAKLKFLPTYVDTSVFEKLFEYYDSEEYQESGLEKFIELNSILDQQRKTDWRQTFPELDSLIKC